MRHSKLASLNFMALCCVLGLFTKKLINPLANVITESLHIPGGISTGFSIMFLVVAAEVVRGGACSGSRNRTGGKAQSDRWSRNSGKARSDSRNRTDGEVGQGRNTNAPENPWKYCGALMGAVQGFLALCLGRIGSMGLLAPVGYFVPGVAIDLVYGLSDRFGFDRTERMVFANVLAAVMASVTANVIVFRLWGPVLLLYLCVSATSGTIYGFLGAAVAGKLQRVCFAGTSGIQNG